MVGWAPADESTIDFWHSTGSDPLPRRSSDAGGRTRTRAIAVGVVLDVIGLLWYLV